MTFFTPTETQRRSKCPVAPLLAVMFLVCAATQAFAADSLYQHFGFTTNWPAIDATVFDNRGTFRSVQTTFPADTTDTLTFLNRGEMSGQPGFRFDHVTSSTRNAALNFTNFESAVINAFDSPQDYWGYISGINGFFFVNPGVAPAPGSFCIVNSTNIADRGLLKVGNAGLLQLTGKQVDLTRGTLAAGDVSDFRTNYLFNQLTFSNFVSSFANLSFLDQFQFAGDGSVLGLGLGLFGGFEYLNPPHVYDLFWAVNGDVFFGNDDSASLLDPNDPTGLIVHSPTNFITGRASASVFPPPFLSLPLTANAKFAAKAFLTSVGTSNFNVNVVFYNTNTDVSIDPEFTFATNVSFFGFTNVLTDLPDCIVQFADTNVFDVATGTTVTNAIYLIDHSSSIFGSSLQSNVAYVTGVARPSAFEITTVQPPQWGALFTNAFNGIEGVYPYDRTLLTGGGPFGDFIGFNFLNESSIYGAQVGRNPETLNGLTAETNSIAQQFNNLLALQDVTNDVPRIEITATNLNLSGVHIRSEGLIKMNNKNLDNGTTAGVDAGTLIGDIGSTNGFLQISNLVSSSFKRVRGNIYAWAGTYFGILVVNGSFTNFVTTHVLIVDQNLKGNFTPTFQNLTLHGTNTLVQDNFRVNKSLLIDADSLTINSTVHLSELAQDFKRANAPHLKDLLIDVNGALLVDNVAFVGWDTKNGLNTFINHGLFAAPAPLIKATYVQNTGTIEATNGGSIILQGSTVDLLNSPVPSFVPVNTLLADRDIEIDAATVNLTNSTIIAGTNGTIGTLTLNVTDSLSDFVPNIPGTVNVINNFWFANNGIIVPQKANGDLFGTEIDLITTNRNQAQIVWPGEDVGAGSDGFNNNLVVGHLILDQTDSSSTFHFSAAGDQNAMYVDYLELRDFAFSNYRNALVIDPNMTIYFASANIEPDKLQAVYPGRLVWANSFTGPNSTKAVARRDGTICLMNRSLADSFIIDLDNDGIVNALDPFPLDNDSNPAFSLPCPGDTLTTSARTFLTDNGGKGLETSLAISVTGYGKVTPQQKSPVVQLGTTFNLHAVANPGNLFAGWSGSVNTTQPNISFVLGSNMVLNARFVTNPFVGLRGSFNGLFYDTNNVTVDNAGSIALSIFDTAGDFSGTLGMTAGVVPFRGHFDADGNATVVATRAKKTPFTLNLKLDTTGGSQQITGTISCDTNWTATVVADRAVFGGHNVAPFNGSYTFAWQGTNDVTAGPAGDSYGTALINRTGTLIATIRLADNNTVSQVVPVSKDGNWPLFKSLYGKEMLIGWVHIDNNGVMSGTINWIKNAMTFGYYRAGFTNAVPVNGSIWVAPKNHTSGLNLTTPIVTLTGGNLAADIVLSSLPYNPTTLTFSSTNPSLSLKLIPSLGLFNGRFTDPTTSRVRLFNGVMLQNQNQARGYFFGMDQSGALRLDNP